MKTIKISIFIFIVCFTCFTHGQTPAEKEFIQLYKQNYIEWISSPEIARLQARNPDLNALIDRIPIQETMAFKEAFREAEQYRSANPEMDLAELLGDGAMDVSMDVIKELVSTENTDIIINMYWKVLKSAESQEVVDLIMPHVMKAKEEFERTGVEIANTVKR